MQKLLSLQLSGVPGAQTPAWQVSAPLQTVESAHEVPFGTGACWQPSTGSQLSAVHELLSLQLGAVPGTQAPAWQVREGAARALSGATAELAVPRLSQALVDEHLDVRKAAVLSLSRWADSDVAARDALSVALKDDDADVRAYARRALACEPASPR